MSAKISVGAVVTEYVTFISMAKYKTAVSPLLMHWRYCSPKSQQVSFHGYNSLNVCMQEACQFIIFITIVVIVIIIIIL